MTITQDGVTQDGVTQDGVTLDDAHDVALDDSDGS